MTINAKYIKYLYIKYNNLFTFFYFTSPSLPTITSIYLEIDFINTTLCQRFKKKKKYI